MIKYNDRPYHEISDLWHTLYSSFNTAQDYCVDKEILEEIPQFAPSSWYPFLEVKFTSSITKCNKLSALGPNKLAWRHLKYILQDNMYLKNVINITNACIKFGYQSSHFKTSTTVVIPKPNKLSYDSLKSFRPIILLNTLGKLIKKVIGDRLQFHLISNNFIYQSQLGSLKFKATIDADIMLTYFICMGQVKKLSTSTLVFDISQFFPSLNHCLLPCILRKAGFDPKIVCFFSNYIVGRKTWFF